MDPGCFLPVDCEGKRDDDTIARDSFELIKKACSIFLPYLQECRQKNCRIYCALYILIEVLLFLSVLSLVLCCWPACALARFFENLLSFFLRPKVMAAVVSLVGLPGVVFAWLISRMEDRICGLRMSLLIEWAYPNFFILYFFLFIALSVLAVFCGNSERFWPTFYAFCGILLTLALLCRVCYLFVIRSKRREEYAFQYYTDRLSRSNGQNAKFQETLLNVTDYVHFLLSQEHQAPLISVVEVWLKAFPKGKPAPSLDENFLSYTEEQANEVLQHSALYSAAWGVLLPNGPSNHQNVNLLTYMLEQIDESTNPGRNGSPESHAYSRHVILLGLVQFLLESGYLMEENGPEQLCALAARKKDLPAVQELVCGLLSALSVEWTAGNLRAERAMSRIFCLFGSVLEQCLLPGSDSTGEKRMLAFLFHVRLIAQKHKSMSTGVYLLCISDLLRKLNKGINTFSDFTYPNKQRDLLLALLFVAGEGSEEEE